MTIFEKCGFALQEAREVSDIGGRMEIYEHERSGAGLCFLNREDECKTFAISFKTLPTDSTGVFHIIEHAVLCGSKKYTTKEPFTDLLRSSMNTFLNAMTYPDKTVYPVASKNDRDFANLVSVYMDAVFYPRMLECEEIFRQEGWRYERGAGGEIVYNGVVYSEMKGAYSSVDDIAERYMSTLLFKDGTYSHDSGGDPTYIPDLTYEDFKRAHTTYYTPENAYIILDGSVDLDTILPIISSYLDKERTGIRHEIDEGRGIVTEPCAIGYMIDDKEDARDKTRLSLGYVTGRPTDTLRANAYNMIFDTIADTNTSRLKKKILDTGLCTSVGIYPTQALCKTTLTVEFKDVRDGKTDELICAFDKALDEIIAEGISDEELSATIDLAEFRSREGDYGSYPRGIINALSIADYVNLGLHPYNAVSYNEDYSALRAKIGTGYYLDLLKELKEMERATLILTPDRTQKEKEGERVRERISREISALSESELGALYERMDAFALWQLREDEESDLATIPRLSLSDLTKPMGATHTEVNEVEGATILTHTLPTTGITYTELYFDVSDLSPSDISLISFFNSVYTLLDTKSHTAEEFRRISKSTLGELSISMSEYQKGDSTRIYISFRISSLDSKRPHALTLLGEALYEKIFDNPSVIRNRIRQAYSSIREALCSQGHLYAIRRVGAGLSPTHAIREYASGYEYLVFIRSLLDITDEELSLLTSRAQGIYESALTRERLTVGISSQAVSGYDSDLVKIIKSGGVKPSPSAITPLPIVAEGIAIPSQVSYAVLGIDLDRIEGRLTKGVYTTLTNLMTYNLLWDEVRVKGGAYGAGFITKHNSGVSFFYSYRDPSPLRTLGIFETSPTSLIERLPDDEGLTDAIIAAVGGLFGQVRTPALEGSTATSYYLTGLTHDDLLDLYRGIVETTREELTGALNHLRELIPYAKRVVVGPRECVESLGLDRILEL